MFMNLEQAETAERIAREDTVRTKMKRVEAIVGNIMDDETISEEAKAQIIETITVMGDCVAIMSGWHRNKQPAKPKFTLEH